MEQGFTIDYTHGTQLAEQASWAKGEPPKRSFWMGGIRLTANERLPIITFRCPNCGQLKSFALL